MSFHSDTITLTPDSVPKFENDIDGWTLCVEPYTGSTNVCLHFYNQNAQNNLVADSHGRLLPSNHIFIRCDYSFYDQYKDELKSFKRSIVCLLQYANNCPSHGVFELRTADNMKLEIFNKLPTQFFTPEHKNFMRFLVEKFSPSKPSAANQRLSEILTQKYEMALQKENGEVKTPMDVVNKYEKIWNSARTASQNKSLTAKRDGKA